MRISSYLRIVLVCCSLLASIAFAFVLLLSTHSAARADPTLVQTTVPAIDSSHGADPWGIALDKKSNVWVAEPQCDINVNAVPVCSPTVQGGILEYPVSSFSNGVQPEATLITPPGYSSPFFLAFDRAGNLWFTEPVSNAIGEYKTASGTWQQWSAPTPNASPLDLAFDKYGHLWFTELSANQIGEFDPTTSTFLGEFAPPTANSRPYGITGPDPTTGSIWFTENSDTVHRIGRITPNANGSINGAIKEYLTNSSATSGITPHLITYDQKGDIWWSEGFDASIGKLVISQAVNNTHNGVTEYVVPSPGCPTPANGCGSHISGIGVDSSGAVWFDDSLSSRYGSFNPATQTFSMYIIGGSVTNNTHPHDGLAVDGNNDVWISEEFDNKLDESLAGTITPPTPSPTPPPLQTGPVSKSWYFAEGRVGGGFNEYLSMDNPTANDCSVAIEYLYTPDGHSPLTKQVVVTIPAHTRAEEGVDGDLGTSSHGHGITDSAILTVDNTATPNCTGIVAERPMYFNSLGVNSGSDVLGVTSLATSFYLADVAVGAQSGGGSISSFLPILNPPGGSGAATVTATYYANGAAIGTDQTVVAVGTRGTIFPNKHQPKLPARVAVVVTSTVPVAVERPTYFSNINAGNAGTVSGGADVIGVQALASDWLFAEGYTGGQFQEYFAIANLDKTANATANVTIKLETSTGVVSSFNLSVPTLGQVLWNVNTSAPNAQVSAEISSTGAQIVAEREMFFHYSHQANGRSLSATGGSDALGQPGPAARSLYSFAEGYTNVDYDEWLTLQNPTANAESIWITLYNALGKTYAYAVVVGPHSRATQDIVAVVLQHLYHSGDGFKGFEVSMTVQTTTAGAVFVAERPMYWNASGTQGGSAITGYTGG
ncbi:MAG TPA: hypothetical protein VKR83_05955 [Ktedonobacteraceae bacterium]|nr:hypothetical protein [Ktedonobacteraceae bacterium]